MAWLLVFAIVGTWLVPAAFFFLRYQARRYRMSAIIMMVCLAIIPLGADSLGFLPKRYGLVVALVVLVFGLLIDVAVYQEVKHPRPDPRVTKPPRPT